jgi:bifunctional UDP-N-acetylglucosamine pyrophosphorylase / glucosamine-1-phosphate N-acetyltransferase
MNQTVNMPLDVVIMAAGKGTRMKSALPKVLQRLGGKPLLQHVVETAAELKARSVVVITGHQSEVVVNALNSMNQSFNAINNIAEKTINTPAVAKNAPILAINSVLQEPQLGTGHAVQQAVPKLPDDGMVLVLSGDVPLTQADTLKALIALANGEKLALLTIDFANPSGYGRVVRSDEHSGEKVTAIVEQKDASDAQKLITEVYSGIMAVPAKLLKGWLARLDNKNAQAEYYLTDIVKFAVADDLAVVAHKINDAAQVAGVNSPVQLAELEREYQLRQAKVLMEQGVRLADPARFDLRGSLLCGQDVEIDINCIFSGQVSLGTGVKVGAHCVISNARIADGAVIQPFTHIEGEKLGVSIGAGALVGPFARLRPGAVLGKDVHIGNFVEVKNATLADGAKANHLAYLGDALVGERVNFGAGSITANYDGANKHLTVIEADVHVGSNCVLVAPVTIGAGGTVGGGSTITKSTPAGALSVARGKQVSMTNWQRPKKIAK